MASSATSRRSRNNSSRSDSASAPLTGLLVSRSRLTQFANVPGLIPRSLATSTMGLPVSRTIRTAPARNCASNCRLVSAMNLYPLRSGLHATGEPQSASRRASCQCSDKGMSWGFAGVRLGSARPCRIRLLKDPVVSRPGTDQLKAQHRPDRRMVERCRTGSAVLRRSA
jgi:hypothetical protein